MTVNNFNIYGGSETKEMEYTPPEIPPEELATSGLKKIIAFRQKHNI